MGEKMNSNYTFKITGVALCNDPNTFVAINDNTPLAITRMRNRDGFEEETVVVKDATKAVIICHLTGAMRVQEKKLSKQSDMSIPAEVKNL